MAVISFSLYGSGLVDLYYWSLVSRLKEFRIGPPGSIWANRLRGKETMKSCTVILVGFALLILSAMNLPAQFTSATLTGVVSDPSGAVVPQAKVKLVNEKTGDARDTVTNNDGYYTFAGMEVGDLPFKLTVEAKGFVTFDAPGISP